MVAGFLGFGLAVPDGSGVVGRLTGAGRCRFDRCGLAAGLGRKITAILPIWATNAAPPAAQIATAVASRADRSLVVMRILMSS